MSGFGSRWLLAFGNMVPGLQRQCICFDMLIFSKDEGGGWEGVEFNALHSQSDLM